MKGRIRTVRAVLPTFEGQSIANELPVTKPGAELIDELNNVGIKFLMNDLDVARSFLDMAFVASDHEQRERFCRHARRAHDTVLHLLSRLNCSEGQKAEINAKLSRIRRRLESCNSSEASGRREHGPFRPVK